VVEDRVRLKCLLCPSYGNNLKCPPYTPSTENFRKILKEYHSALVVKINPPEISEEVMAKYKLKDKLKEKDEFQGDEPRLWDEYQDLEDISSKIWSDFNGIYRNILMVLLEIERAAFIQGYAFATAFFGGKCMLCEKCDVGHGKCLNPMMSRFASEAMGINMLKTAKNAGMELKFCTGDNPTPITPMAILLID
jgi:predicted metal-binding protein